MRVLLSIKPEHADNIFAGRKTFEFRRRIFAKREINTVLVYVTRPIARFIGEFDIDGILEDAPSVLWDCTEVGSGISKDYFDEYFGGRTVGYALCIGEKRRFSAPIDPAVVIPNFKPPQSFMYVAGKGADIRRSKETQLR